MSGPDCPTHKTPMDWLSTSNQWEFYCKECDKRYSRTGEPMPTTDAPTWLLDRLR